MSNDPVEDILEKLHGVKREGHGWKALCPAHDDHSPSLAVSRGTDGCALVKCRAGCTTDAVLAAIDKTMADLFPNDLATSSKSPSRSAPRSPWKWDRPIETTYSYTDAHGEELYQVVRFVVPVGADKEFGARHRNGSGGWIRDVKGIERVLYHLPQVIEAVASGNTVYVVEGEKDADNLTRAGVIATTNVWGAGNWNPGYTQALTGAHVVILPDNDDAGRKHATTVATAIHGAAASVRILELPGLPSKGDVSDWLASGGTIADLERLVAATEPIDAPPGDTRIDQQPPVSGHPEGTAGDPVELVLPMVETNARQLRDVTADALAALVLANDPPRLFVRAGRLVRIDTDEHGHRSLRVCSALELRERLGHAANFVSTSEKRGTISVLPPIPVAENILAAGYWPDVPPIAGVVEAPVVAPDGCLETSPGYLPKSHLYFDDTQIDLRRAIGTDVAGALVLLRDEILSGYPFADTASFAHTLALILQPFVRPMIDGPCPLYLIDKPQVATGASLLAATCIAVSATPTPSAAPREEAEWRKLLTSMFLQGVQHVWIDNLKGKIDSGALEAALTASTWRDRILGGNDAPPLDVRCTFVATSNNAELSQDLATRSVPIRLDARVQKPWERTGFKIEHPPTWVREHRGQVVDAALVLVSTWLDAGMPAYSGKHVSRFSAWSRVMGGILETVGIPGFLDNLAGYVDTLAPEEASWSAFVDIWHETHGEKWVQLNDLQPLALGAAPAHTDGCLSDYIRSDTERGRGTAFGTALRKRRDRTYAGYRIQADPRPGRKAAYRLQLADLSDLADLAHLTRREYRCEENQHTDTPLGADQTGLQGLQGLQDDDPFATEPAGAAADN